MNSSASAAPERTLLVLILAPALEEELIDYLLSLESVDSFTSQQIHGHGEHESLTVAEQVSGRRRRVQYQVILARQALAGLLAGLAEQVGRGIEYWEQPISGYGHIR